MPQYHKGRPTDSKKVKNLHLTEDMLTTLGKHVKLITSEAFAVSVKVKFTQTRCAILLT